MKVVWLEDGDHSRWTVAGTFNRRLVVYRLLAIYMPLRFQRLQCTRVPYSSAKWKYNGRHKLSTQCHGVYVEVRKKDFVGRGKLPRGEDKYGVHWLEADHLLSRLAAAA